MTATPQQPSDQGLELVRDLHKKMQVDPEWCVWDDRGFTWWGKNLAQRVWAEAPRKDEAGETFQRLHAETDVFDGFDGSDEQVQLLNLINHTGTLSALAPAGDGSGRVRLCCSMLLYPDNADFVRLVFDTAATLQAAEAVITTSWLGDEFRAGLTNAVSHHPASGERLLADEMLEIVDLAIQPMGESTSLYVGAAMDKLGKDLQQPPCIFASGSETGVSAEYPHPKQSYLLRLLTEDKHPRLGHGTGKTACLTMRMLKLIFVDGVPPNGIQATTFTKKAAEELRSRLLSWGYGVLEHLQTKESLSKMQRLWLDRVDINQVRTGTIDSICEELLQEFRDPGTDPPILADQFVSETLLLRAGMFGGARYKDDDLDEFLCNTRGTGRFGWNLGAKTGLVRSMWDRRHHDQIDWAAFTKSGWSKESKAALKHLGAAHADYAKELQDRLMVDFAQLEQSVLDRLNVGGMREFTDQLEVLMVDEYQDSNLLQERLYFALAKRCGGALTVVGDDDQSLYRFRGATVDLYSNFEARYAKVFKKVPKKIFLNENYRSTSTIIDFVNSYATFDAGYQAVRVKGKPPLVNPKSPGSDFPILGMFRSSLSELAASLANFIHDVTRGGGRRIGNKVLRIDVTNGGDVGDCALLCSSPQEYGYAAAGNPPKERLPLLLKRELSSKKRRIEIFNPRGQDFADIPIVRRLGGLLLICLDLGGDAEDKFAKALGQRVRNEFQGWVTEATNWLKTAPKELRDYVDHWSNRNPGRSGLRWPTNVSCIDLLYALVHWMPELHDDPEGQVYLEVFTRQLGAAEQVSQFKANVVTKPTNPDLSKTSVGHLLLYFLAPIAAGTAQVDEELVESFPRERLSVLSIHQSKGLEFPLVIVDVGSDFNSDHRANAFKRFPHSPNMPQNLEDLMRPHSPLSVLKRDGLDRAFDDLMRQFFVAFSRPQDALLLVGLDGSHPQKGHVRNVATGWDRTGVNRWQKKLPFVEI